MPFAGYCSTCDNETTLFHSSSVCEKAKVLSEIKTRTPYEVNVRMVCYTGAIRKGQSCLNAFAKCMNMPGAIHSKAYETILGYHCKATSRIADESFKNAGKEVKEKFGGEVGVSVDGSWQRRGHASHNGIVTAISIDTGKCLDILVLSNTCKQCMLWEKAYF